MEETKSTYSSTAQIHEFCNLQKIAMGVTFAFGISALMIVIIAVNLLLMFISSSNQPFMPGIMGGLSVIPIFGIWTGIYLLKRPRKILVSPQGVVIVGMIGRKEISWQTIADVEIKEVESVADNWIKTFSGPSAVQKKRIVLRDSGGRQIGVIDGNIERFDTLTAMIISGSSQSQGKTVFDTDRQKSRTIIARKRKLRLNLGAGLFLLLMAIAAIVFFSVDYHGKQTLEKQGKSVDATIKRLYIYNVTPRLEYTFTASDKKTYSKDVMVNREFYDQLKEGQTVAVKYVPANPDNSRLMTGHIEDFDIPFPIMLVCALVILGIGGGAIAMYFLEIVDIKQEGGRWVVVRVNDPDPSLVPATPAPATVPQYQNVQTQTVPVAVPVEIPAAPGLSCSVASQEKEKLPGGLKAIGILNIVFGALGILWNVFKIFFVLLFVTNLENTPTIGEPENWGWALAGHGLALVCAFMLCVSGIGILQFANWGRILALIAASIKIGMGLWEMAGVFRFQLPGAEDLGSEQVFLANTTKVFYIFIIILTLIYPLIVLILLGRRSARQRFKKE